MRIRLKHQVLAEHLGSSALSQNRWAVRLGVSTGHLSELVNGKKIYPSAETRQKLLKGTNLSFQDLFLVEHERAAVQDRPRREQFEPLLEVSCLGLRLRMDRIGRFRNGRAGTMHTLFQDLRYGWRSMWASPAITLVAILTIGLSIGGNAAIFSLVNGVLFKPLSFREPGELVLYFGHDRRDDNRYRNLSFPNYLDLKERNQSFSDLAVFRDINHDLKLGNRTQRIVGARVSASFLKLLEVVPHKGRFFDESADLTTTERLAVITSDFWRNRLGGKEDILGSRLTLDAETYQVVGVLPPDFTFPKSLAAAEVWTPVGLDDVLVQERGTGFLNGLGRLRPDVSIESAQLEMTQLAADLERENEGIRDFGIHLIRLHDHLVSSSRMALLLLLGAVGVVLLIACANVASLTLARGTARQSELAMRRALGASRWRVVRQLVTESLALALLGGALGLILARLTLGSILNLLPRGFPRVTDVSVDFRVLAFCLAVSALAALVFGLIPAFQNSRTSPVSILKQGGRSMRSRQGTWLRSGLVVTEVALTLILLVGAGLLTRSFAQLVAVDPGFDSERVLVFEVARPFAQNTVGEQRLAYYQQVVQEVSSLPGIISVTGTNSLPFSGIKINVGIEPLGQSEATDEGLSARYNSVLPGFLETLRVPLLQGRYLDSQDRRGAPGAIVVNRALAEQIWPGRSAIGERMNVGASFDQEGEPLEFGVVGVVANLQSDAFDVPAVPALYVSQAQHTWPFFTFVVKTAGPPKDQISVIQQAVANVDSDQAVFGIQSMADIVGASVARQRLALVLVSVFATLALILASVGLYGVISYQVARRIPELGIRMAVGARRMDVLGLVMRNGLRLTVLGLIIGIIGAFATSRLLSGFLFELSPIDPLTYTIVTTVLLMVALLACYLPAYRATRLDPCLALRSE